MVSWQVVLRLVSLQLWESLSPGRRMLELNAFPQLKRHWQHLEAKKVGSKQTHTRVYTCVLMHCICSSAGTHGFASNIGAPN